MKNCPNCESKILSADQLCIYCGYLFFNNEQTKINQEYKTSTFSVTAAGIDYDIYFLTNEKFNDMKLRNLNLYNVDLNKEFDFLFNGQLVFNYEEITETGEFDCTTVIETIDEDYNEEISVDFKLINERIENKIIERIFDSLNKYDDFDLIFIRYSLEKGLMFFQEFDHQINEQNTDFFEKNLKLITYEGYCESFEFKNEEIFFENVDFHSSKGIYYKLFKIKDLKEVDFFDFEE